MPELSAGDRHLQTVVRPHSVVEIGQIIRTAAVEQKAIFPLGGQTMQQWGLPPTRDGIGVDLRGLHQVIDYPARDMTITVQAGVTISELREILASESQRLPVDVPFPERATLGGALATNVNGPRRFGFGTFRDYVIGISVLNDQGQEIKAGGRVVKNVAGYDLCKLYIGSLGTLGIISQVTLKLKPRPERTTLIELLCPDNMLASVLDRLHTSRTRPASISVLNADPLSAERLVGRWAIWVGYEDNCAAVTWQVQQLRRESAEFGTTVGRELSDGEASPVWSALGNFPLSHESVLTFKASLLPGKVSDFCTVANQLPEKPVLQAEAGNGIVTGHFAGDLTLEQARTILTTLQDAANASEAQRANVIVLGCPAAWKKELPIWGLPRGDIWLMRAIKEKLDPKGIFNPGRFVDGI